MVLGTPTYRTKRGIFAELMRTKAGVLKATSEKVHLGDVFTGSRYGGNTIESPPRTSTAASWLNAKHSASTPIATDGTSDDPIEAPAITLDCSHQRESTILPSDAHNTTPKTHAVEDSHWTTLRASLTSSIVSSYHDKELDLLEPYAQISTSELQDRIGRNLRILAAINAEINQGFTCMQIEQGKRKIDGAMSEDESFDGRVIEAAIVDVLIMRLKDILKIVGLREGWEWELKSAVRGWVQDYISSAVNDSGITSQGAHRREERDDANTTRHSIRRWSHNDISGLILAWLQYLSKVITDTENGHTQKANGSQIQAGVERANGQGEVTSRMENSEGGDQFQEENNRKPRARVRRDSGCDQYVHGTAWEPEENAHIKPGVDDM